MHSIRIGFNEFSTGGQRNHDSEFVRGRWITKMDNSHGLSVKRQAKSDHYQTEVLPLDGLFLTRSAASKILF